MTTMTTTLKKTNWVRGLKNPQPFVCDADESDFNYISFWLGRSCGARAVTKFTPIPEKRTGIVVYEGLRFMDIKPDGQQIDWVETRNGPLTIVSDLKKK